MSGTARIVLAIESAVAGGSISLLRDGVEIANWIGNSGVSKAEDVLPNIDAILTSNNISRNEINLVAASAGPGSFTGIRIGLATALGLKAGLGISMASESALRAMAFAQKKEISGMVVAVPMGRDAVCWQRFERSGEEIAAIDDPATLTEREFAARVETETGTTFVLHENLLEKVKPSPTVVNFGSNLAYAVALICAENDNIVIEPLFISKSF